MGRSILLDLGTKLISVRKEVLVSGRGREFEGLLELTV